MPYRATWGSTRAGSEPEGEENMGKILYGGFHRKEEGMQVRRLRIGQYE